MTTLARARFSQLVLPRLDEGYRLAHWLTGNATDAEDVMQEACLRAYRAIEGFAEGNARAWFLTIVRNTGYSWLQRHRPKAVIFAEDLTPEARAELEGGGLLAEAPVTPEAAVIARDEAGQLARAVDALPVAFREALVLREYHGLSYREIAAVTGVPIGTVMSRLGRARQHLLTRLAKDGR
ncbi:sigma-70 family RNA polymerase sigma factor [Methylobacterium sp. A49B]|uniref:Sigma-70 family RNA polymerase sigma factor n=1 Tax=Methylobacterium mesophilicum SR1.6/6 TaxID=908290 RepID=A0A6B9F8T6_9HYPH|nr:sigma-70 family RNA polymerase sigma factor [Methylobacterium mesophilicum]QGY00553.1 sigma-70 family RNA polymerase sigma factor [Methylobacterium mesophilicum SR1.6/6]